MPYSTCMSSRRGTGTFNPFFQNKILQIMDVPLLLCSRRVSPDSSAEILATSLSGVSPLLSAVSPMVSCHARDEVFKHFVQKDFRILTMMIARLKLMCKSYKSVRFEMREMREYECLLLRWSTPRTFRSLRLIRLTGSPQFNGTS